jgi:hypothetical protein
MRFQVVHNWPVGQYVIPGGTICDRNDPTTYSQIGVQHIPPNDSVPLDAGATNLLAAVYDANGKTKEQFPPPNIANF